MTPADARTNGRAELGAIAADLGGERAKRRSAGLARMLAGTPRAAVSLEALAAAPAWVRLDPNARRALGRRAALAAIAPAIARSIDGAWLGGLARAAGDEALDWAVAQGATADQAMPIFAAERIDAVGAGIVRAATPAALYGFVERGDATLKPAVAAALLDRAMRP